MIADPSSIVDILRRRATRQKGQQAYTFLADREGEEESITYGELDRRARAIGGWLQSSGAAGERVLLLLPPGLECIAAFFGCLYAAAVAVPAYAPRLNETWSRLRSIIGDAQPTFGITTSTILSRLETMKATGGDLAALRWLSVDWLEKDACGEWREPDVCRDTLAFIQYTSGSTGEPKGVMVSHGNLLENSAIIHERFEHTTESRGVIWLPPYHDMGLIGGVLQPLYGGFPVTLMSPTTFLLRPVRWLQVISQTRASTSGGPNFAYDLCARKISPEQRGALDLSCWRVAFNGSEPVRLDTIERFASVFASAGFRREAFFPCYGLAEATLFVTGGPKSSGPVHCKIQNAAVQQNRAVLDDNDPFGHTLVACGERPRNVKVVIVHPDSWTRCSPHEIGEIWVSGLSVATGYWRRPQETESAFRAHLADSGEGPFLRTGDLGFFLRGQLFVAGRLKDLIIVGGRNHYPQDIEATVERAHSVLRLGRSAAFSLDLEGEERLIIVAEVDHRHGRRGQNSVVATEKLVRAIRTAVAEQHGLHVHRVFLLKRGSIPMTTSGKIQRNICRSWVLTREGQSPPMIWSQTVTGVHT